jgi:hypothetical protein
MTFSSLATRHDPHRFRSFCRILLTTLPPTLCEVKRSCPTPPLLLVTESSHVVIPEKPAKRRRSARSYSPCLQSGPHLPWNLPPDPGARSPNARWSNARRRSAPRCTSSASSGPAHPAPSTTSALASPPWPTSTSSQSKSTPIAADSPSALVRPPVRFAEWLPAPERTAARRLRLLDGLRRTDGCLLARRTYSRSYSCYKPLIDRPEPAVPRTAAAGRTARSRARGVGQRAAVDGRIGEPGDVARDLGGVGAAGPVASGARASWTV